MHLNALSFVMSEVSKVFLGAHALLANGVVMSRVGTATVSMVRLYNSAFVVIAQMAHDRGVPVIACCETYKFSDRVQLDSFVSNETGLAEDLIDTDGYKPIAESILHVDKGLSLGAEVSADTKKNQKDAVVKEEKKSSGAVEDFAKLNNFSVLNIMYDVTPSEFVTVVITEVGMIPCTSIPVVLRESTKASLLASGRIASE